MADASSLSVGDGVAFLVSAEVMASIIAKACSSPQTVHINAGTRAATLMQWVNIGLIEGVGLVLVAAAIDKKHRTAILAGAGLEAAITYGEYVYAKRAGLKNPGPGTESNGPTRGASLRWA